MNPQILCRFGRSKVELMVAFLWKCLPLARLHLLLYWPQLYQTTVLNDQNISLKHLAIPSTSLLLISLNIFLFVCFLLCHDYNGFQCIVSRNLVDFKKDVKWHTFLFSTNSVKMKNLREIFLLTHSRQSSFTATNWPPPSTPSVGLVWLILYPKTN